jgi:hypothetical protein
LNYCQRALRWPCPPGCKTGEKPVSEESHHNFATINNWGSTDAMCNLYAQTKGQQAIRELTRAMLDRTGNLPPLPGIFPDYPAPIVRNTAEGRELTRRIHLKFCPKLWRRLGYSAGDGASRLPRCGH